MQIGASLFLIAIGAVLRWGVTERVKGIEIPVVGNILMVVGALGLVLSLFIWFTRRDRDVVERDVVDRRPPL